jgi:hypothetical protein
MKQLLLILVATISFLFSQAQTNIQVFYRVPFFGGYGAYVNSPAPPAGVIRHRNDLNARKLTDAEIADIGSKLSMRVSILAACDNYDRIGNVNLALVPKDSTRYVPAQVARIELGRYITPFMDKNKSPNTVEYDYQIDHVAQLLKDSTLNALYNFWIELELFGVESAAQQQVAGCTGRKDVFYGTLEFFSEDTLAIQNNTVLIPMSMKKNLNNYQASATDSVGKTIRTLSFRVNDSLSDAAFFLITSNHGANSGGEEYNRRNHFVYFNDTLKLTYKPGRTSCEPFRVYNTQGNGIYGATPKSDAQWQSFSNWCPGDVIDTRRINLGSLDTGLHRFKIEVPDARFVNREGYIPLSVYLLGKTSGMIDIPADTTNPIDTSIVPGPVDPLPNQALVYPNPASQFVHVRQTGNFSVCVYHAQGGLIFRKENLQNNYTMDISGYSPGIYLIKVIHDNHEMTKRLVIAR